MIICTISIANIKYYIIIIKEYNENIDKTHLKFIFWKNYILLQYFLRYFRPCMYVFQNAEQKLFFKFVAHIRSIGG